jgi:hypothetical protein
MDTALSDGFVAVSAQKFAVIGSTHNSLSVNEN